MTSNREILLSFVTSDSAGDHFQTDGMLLDELIWIGAMLLMLIVIGLSVYAYYYMQQRRLEEDPEAAKTLLQHENLRQTVMGWHALGRPDPAVWSWLIPRMVKKTDHTLEERDFIKLAAACRSQRQLEALIIQYPAFHARVNEWVREAYEKVHG